VRVPKYVTKESSCLTTLYDGLGSCLFHGLDILALGTKGPYPDPETLLTRYQGRVNLVAIRAREEQLPTLFGSSNVNSIGFYGTRHLRTERYKEQAKRMIQFRKRATKTLTMILMGTTLRMQKMSPPKKLSLGKCSRESTKNYKMWATQPFL
jgi:hypothetical protein